MDFKEIPKISEDSMSKTLKAAILHVLTNDPKTMPLNVLMHKVFRLVKAGNDDVFIKQEDFFSAMEELTKNYLIGRNRYNKWFIDYLDYPKSNVFGEGYLEIDNISGNGYITVKKNFAEYKKSSHFVHKKNLNGAQHGDYVKYVELLVNNPKNSNKFVLIDASVETILEKYKGETEVEAKVE